MGRTHDLELVLTLADRLSSREDIAFLFVGYGGKARLVDQHRRKEQLSNMLFLPRQPREMLGAMLACSNATIISFVGGMFGVSVPSRMYNVMAAGVPIIAVADPRSELSLLVEEAACGWTFTADAIDRIEQLILSIASEAGARDAAGRGDAGRRAVERDYTLDTVIAKFRALLDQQ